MAGDGRSRDERQARFERLYRQHGPDVHAYVVRRVGWERADDIVADVFVVAWRRLEAVPDEAMPWLLGVARKTIANRLRSTRRQFALATRLAAQVPAVQMESSSSDAAVLAALGSLRERDREVLMLIAWEGLGGREASKVLGCSHAAFRVRLHRSRARFAKALRAAEARAELPRRGSVNPRLNHSLGEER